jgi:hypothetical protein
VLFTVLYGGTMRGVSVLEVEKQYDCSAPKPMQQRNLLARVIHDLIKGHGVATRTISLQDPHAEIEESLGKRRMIAWTVHNDSHRSLLTHSGLHQSLR